MADPDGGTRWMLAFARGDEDAFDRIVNGYRIPILRFLSRRVRDAARAEDLTQEVFLRIYRARGSYRPSASFRSWIFTIAHRLALNELRAVRRRGRVFARWLPFGNRTGPRDETAREDFWASIPARDEPSPGEVAEAGELEEVIRKLVESLPPSQRAALELVSGEQLSYEEAAGVLGVSVASVRSLLVRARERLRSGVRAYRGWTDSTDSSEE